MLGDAHDVLAVACPLDRADVVAQEKLFGAQPDGAPVTTFGAWEGDILVGVAAVAGSRIRVLGVIPWARKRGVGSALLAACEQAARASGVTALRTLDQPGNYLAPGIDIRNLTALAWLEKRGWIRSDELRENLEIDVRDNPLVTEERARETANACRDRGYVIRRAEARDAALLAAVTTEFGGAWPFELARAMTANSVHVALHAGAYCAFAAHDGNNQGLGWFGPAGTWPAHRGKGLGEALLLACLVDIADEHARCEVAWIGPRAFYTKVAGSVGTRSFVVLEKSL